eukprot:g7767.t1
MEEVRGERTVLPTLVLRGLGQRPECPVQHELRLSVSDGARRSSDVAFKRCHPPLDRARALDCEGWRPKHGEALVRLLADGKAPEGPRHPPPSLHPAAPSRWHRPPSPERSMDLWQHQDRFATGNTDSTATPAASDMPHLRRRSEGPVAIPSFSAAFAREIAGSRFAATGGGDGGGGSLTGGYGRVLDYRGHRKASPPQSRWSSYSGSSGPSLSGRTPWVVGLMARDRRLPGDACGFGAARQLGEGERERGVGPPRGWCLRSPYEGASLKYPLLPCPTRIKRMRHLVGGGGGGGGGVGGVADVDGLPAAGQVDDVCRGYHHYGAATWAPPPPLSANGDCGDGGGGERHRRAGSLPSKLAPPRIGGYGGTSSLPPAAERGAVAAEAHFSRLDARNPHRPSHTAAAAETTVAWTRPSLSPSWSLGSRGLRVGKEGTSQAGGGVALDFAVGDRRSSTGDRCGGGGRGGGGGGGGYEGARRGREVYLVGAQQRWSPSRDQDQPRRSPQPQDCRPPQDERPQRPPTLPPSVTTLSPPRLGRGISDPGAHSTAFVRPLASSPPPPLVSCSGRPSYPLPRLSAVVSNVERRPWDDLADGDAKGAVRGSAATAAATDAGFVAREGGAERQREGDPTLTRQPVSTCCVEVGCDRRSRFAFKGTKRPAYCAKHRAAGMVDTRHPQCQDKQCTRQPSFGMEGNRRASFCAAHKKAGMINVLARRCQHSECFRHPNFGFPGDRRSSFCKQHREMGMVDIVSRRCHHPSCTRRRLYNFTGLRPVSCSRHKLPGMIDVVSTRCQAPGCLSHPSFGYTSDMKARRCRKHRLENMEGVKGHRQKIPRELTLAAAASATTDITTTYRAPSSPSSSSQSPVRSSPLASPAEDTGAGLASGRSSGIVESGPFASTGSVRRSSPGKTSAEAGSRRGSLTLSTAASPSSSDEGSQEGPAAAAHHEHEHSVRELRQLLDAAGGSAIVLTGAGMSTDSGIPDYRGPRGSYSRGHKPMTHDEFLSFWARSTFGWDSFSRSRPNAAHKALAELEAVGKIRGVMTQLECMTCGVESSRNAFQADLARLNAPWISKYARELAEADKDNIDPSLSTAASGNGHEGGGARLLRADGDADVEPGEHLHDFVVPPCVRCGGVLKPAVVFFGDNIPRRRCTASSTRRACSSPRVHRCRCTRRFGW